LTGWLTDNKKKAQDAYNLNQFDTNFKGLFEVNDRESKDLFNYIDRREDLSVSFINIEQALNKYRSDPITKDSPINVALKNVLSTKLNNPNNNVKTLITFIQSAHNMPNIPKIKWSVVESVLTTNFSKVLSQQEIKTMKNA